MKVLTISTLIAGAVFLAGCTFSDSTASVSHNEKQEDTITNSRPPLTIVLNNLDDGFQENASNLSIEQKVSGHSIESPDKVSIILEEATPMDDSVAAVRYVFLLANINGLWKIENKSVTQRCVSGRGHPDFSSVPCH